MSGNCSGLFGHALPHTPFFWGGRVGQTGFSYSESSSFFMGCQIITCVLVQKTTTREPQVLVHVSTCQGPSHVGLFSWFWLRTLQKSLWWFNADPGKKPTFVHYGGTPPSKSDGSSTGLVNLGSTCSISCWARFRSFLVPLDVFCTLFC